MGGAFPCRRRPAARPGPSVSWLRALRCPNGRRASHALRSSGLITSPSDGSCSCLWCGLLVSTHHAAAPCTGASGACRPYWTMIASLPNGRDASPRSMSCCRVALPGSLRAGLLKTLLPNVCAVSRHRCVCLCSFALCRSSDHRVRHTVHPSTGLTCRSRVCSPQPVRRPEHRGSSPPSSPAGDRRAGHQPGLCAPRPKAVVR